jgi:hypothetical protein
MYIFELRVERCWDGFILDRSVCLDADESALGLSRRGYSCTCGLDPSVQNKRVGSIHFDPILLRLQSVMWARDVRAAVGVAVRRSLCRVVGV